jgi:hypothetical protein
MPTSDLNIRWATDLLILQHGDRATADARKRVDDLCRKRDAEGADTWLRIIVAIGTLGIPPTDARY